MNRRDSTKKVLQMNDLDAVKEQKEFDKVAEKVFARNCLMCEQPMVFYGALVWYCKHCDTITIISPVWRFKPEPGNGRIGFIE
jgi:hypothetical protein